LNRVESYLKNCKMNHLKFVVVLVLFLSMLNACKEKDDSINVRNSLGCVFVQNDESMEGLLDELELMILKECRENGFSAQHDLELNLIGEWELIGHATPWFPIISKPCGYIKISEREMTFEFNNGETDILSTHPYEIEKVNWKNEESFILKLHPEHYFVVNQFCENYMYIDNTPFDGAMFLYKKLN